MSFVSKLFNKQDKDEHIYSPINGDCIPIDQVKDKVFSTKAMGDGVGIIPKQGVVYSPIEGKVVAIFPTNHAIGLINDKGVEILIHIGIDTVELNGKGFESFVKQGDKVKVHQKLIAFDLKEIQQKYDSTVMVIITNSNGVELQIQEATSLKIDDILFKIK